MRALALDLLLYTVVWMAQNLICSDLHLLDIEKRKKEKKKVRTKENICSKDDFHCHGLGAMLACPILPGSCIENMQNNACLQGIEEKKDASTIVTSKVIYETIQLI